MGKLSTGTVVSKFTSPQTVILLITSPLENFITTEKINQQALIVYTFKGTITKETKQKGGGL